MYYLEVLFVRSVLLIASPAIRTLCCVWGHRACVVFLFQVVWPTSSIREVITSRAAADLSFKFKGSFLSRGESGKLQVCLVGWRMGPDVQGVRRYSRPTCKTKPDCAQTWRGLRSWLPGCYSFRASMQLCCGLNPYLIPITFVRASYDFSRYRYSCLYRVQSCKSLVELSPRGLYKLSPLSSSLYHSFPTHNHILHWSASTS